MSSFASSTATLGGTPLLHLLVSMADRQMSGSLCFDVPDGPRSVVVFESGSPRKVAAVAPQSRLSDLLIEFGWLDAHSAEQTYVEAVAQRQPHGQLLLDYSLVDEAGLTNVLVHQMVRKLSWIASRSPQTSLGLHEDTDLLEPVPASPSDVSPLSLVWAVARNHIDERNKRVLMERAGNRPLRLHPHSKPELFGFSAAELSLVERLRDVRRDLSLLFYEMALPRQTAEAMLYVLLLTRHIDIGDGRTPVGVAKLSVAAPTAKSSGEYSTFGPSPQRAADPAPVAREEAVARLRRELKEHAARSDTADSYALLGVPPDAPLGVIRQAFTTLARRYHPERLPIELNDLRPLAAQLLTRLMAAYRGLSDDEQRHGPQRRQSGPAPAGVDNSHARDRLLNRSLGVDALRRAEQLLKRERLLLAEAEAKRAMELDPNNPQSIALHAWIRALIPDNAGSLEQILQSLNQALDLDPVSVQTRFYRSEVLKRLERLEEAVSEWRLILELDPNHIDAQRELRLWEMRRVSSRPARNSGSGMHPQVSLKPPAPGLFGRLFKGPR